MTRWSPSPARSLYLLSTCNFIRKHQTIKTTPAVMVGVADRVWTTADFVKLLECEERMLGGRSMDHKPAVSKKA